MLWTVEMMQGLGPSRPMEVNVFTVLPCSVGSVFGIGGYYGVSILSLDMEIVTQVKGKVGCCVS